MIFITLGSQRFQFNRLLQAVDEMFEEGLIDDEVIAQIGYSDYIPKNYKYKQFLDRNEFDIMVDNCEILITHGGTGAIVGALKKNKKVIAVPRLVKYNEHVDDHQLQIIKEFNDQNLICGLKDCMELKEALNFVKNHQFSVYISNTKKIIESIENYIEE